MDALQDLGQSNIDVMIGAEGETLIHDRVESLDA